MYSMYTYKLFYVLYRSLHTKPCIRLWNPIDGAIHESMWNTEESIIQMPLCIIYTNIDSKCRFLYGLHRFLHIYIYVYIYMYICIYYTDSCVSISIVWMPLYIIYTNTDPKYSFLHVLHRFLHIYIHVYSVMHTTLEPSVWYYIHKYKQP